MVLPKYVHRHVPDLPAFTVVLSAPVLVDFTFLTVLYEEVPAARPAYPVLVVRPEAFQVRAGTAVAGRVPLSVRPGGLRAYGTRATAT